MLVSIQEQVRTLREEIAELKRANDFFKDHKGPAIASERERRELRFKRYPTGINSSDRAEETVISFRGRKQ